ncbi:MAG: lysophospholipid acyltransferase family protein [Flavobacteriaceae bacterium]
MAVFWSDLVLFGMGMFPKVESKINLSPGSPYIFVANHVSMIDIMLMVSSIRNHPLVFIGKKELEKIPFFGYVYKKTMILVDRSSNESKKNVFVQTEKKLKEGISIVIFPEGTVPSLDVNLGPFKHGAFSIAIDHKIPIVPMTFLDNKKRFPWSYGGLLAGSKGSPGQLRVKIHDPIITENMTRKDVNTLCNKVRDLILSDLETS